jgi:hypothetical protein
MSVRKVLLILVALMSFSFPALAQSRRLMGGSAGGRKYQFFYETFLDPSMPELGSMSGGTIGGEGIIHRFMTDPRQRVFFGYDISVDVLPQSNTYRLTFNQLASESVRQILGSDAASWTQLPAPDWGGPAVRTIQAGDVLGLDLLTNNATGQKIVDYITVKKPSSDPDWRFIYETGTAQDFRAEDAALELVSPQVNVNEQPGVSASVPGVNVYGAAVWFYLPGQGRFALTLTPHPEYGFVQAGEVRGSTLSFTVGNDTFNLVSSRRIAPGLRPFHLYVLREPDWKPDAAPKAEPDRAKPQEKSSIWGSSDTVDQLFGK